MTDHDVAAHLREWAVECAECRKDLVAVRPEETIVADRLEIPPDCMCGWESPGLGLTIEVMIVRNRRCPAHGDEGWSSAGPQYPRCDTPGCPGDGRYAPPGRGHTDACTKRWREMGPHS